MRHSACCLNETGSELFHPVLSIEVIDPVLSFSEGIHELLLIERRDPILVEVSWNKGRYTAVHLLLRVYLVREHVSIMSEMSRSFVVIMALLFCPTGYVLLDQVASVSATVWNPGYFTIWPR